MDLGKKKIKCKSFLLLYFKMFHFNIFLTNCFIPNLYEKFRFCLPLILKILFIVLDFV